MEILYYFMKKLKKRNVDDAVLSFNASNARQIKFSDNKIVKDAVELLSDVGIFVVKDKKIFTTTYKDTVDETGLASEKGNFNEMKKKEIDKFINKIMKFLKAIHPKRDYFGINEKTFKYNEINESYDPQIKNLDDYDYVRRGINSAFKEGAKRTNGIFEAHESKNTLLTSSGVEFSEKKSELYFSMRCFIEKDESGHMNAVSRIVKKLDPEEVGAQAGRIARDSKNPVNGQRGKYDIILSTWMTEYLNKEELKKFLRESKNLLSKDGVLITTFISKKGIGYLYITLAKRIRNIDKYNYMEEEVKYLLKEACFKDIIIKQLNARLNIPWGFLVIAR